MYPGPVGLVGDVKKPDVEEEGVGTFAVGTRGKVSKDRVLRQLERSKAKLSGLTGSWVEV